MGKMTMGLILIAGIEFALYLFTGSQDSTNSLLQLLLNPVGAFTGFTSFLNCFGSALSCSGGAVGSNALITAVQLVFVGLTLITALLAGTGILFKQDTVIYASLAAFFGVFALSIVKLWNFIYSNLGNVSASAGIIASLICAPLIVTYIITIVDFARGRD